MFDNERLHQVGSHDCLAHFKKGDGAKPLLLFLPGAAHLARIGYGHPDLPEEEFLAHWAHEAGYSFLGLSYPLKHVVFPKVDPAFSVRDWGKMVGSVTGEYLAQGQEVVVVAWSMAGRLLGVIRDYLPQIELFVALTATAPLLGTSDHYVKGLSFAQLYPKERLMPWLHASLEGKIPDLIYGRDFLGDFPVNLVGSRFQYGREGLVEDLAACVEDTGLTRFAEFPPIASITGTAPLDEHALTHHAMWGALIVRRLFDLGVNWERWEATRELFAQAPQRLSRTLDGTHLLFVGEAGARATMGAIEELREEWRRLAARLD